MVAFKEESTPAQFSTATSLSDLTFDDDAHVSFSCLKFLFISKSDIKCNLRLHILFWQDTGCERKELELSAVSEEEDEHVLADCISIGMQSSNR